MSTAVARALTSTAHLKHDHVRKTSETKLAIFAAVVGLPVLVAIVSLVGYHWHPGLDQAWEVLRVKDVGGRHTPLTGAVSRYGWDHPGPLLFWVLAPFYRVFGATGVLVGVALLNAVALAGALMLARRRGGFRLVVLVALAAAILCHALGPELLIDPWNPWAAVLPFFAYVLLAWSVAERDWVALPWLVGVGSFVVQAHVGYVALVVGLGIAAGVLAMVGGVRHPTAGAANNSVGNANNSVGNARQRSTRVWVIVAGVVGALLWVPPVVQQLTGSRGNLGDIIQSFRDPDDPAAGWEIALGTMGHELEFRGPWMTGNDPDVFGFVPTASTIPGVVLLGATSALGVLAWRRGAKAAGHLAVLAVVGAGLGVLAVSRINGFVYPYLVRWTWVIAALVWLSVAWSICSLVPRTLQTSLGVAALVLATVISVSTAWAATSVRGPLAPVSDAIGELGAGAAAHLEPNARYLVTWVEEPHPQTAVGMVLELGERGFEARVEPGGERAFGSWRTARSSQVDGVITVVQRSTELESGWVAPPGARVISEYDPLTPSQRAQARRLEQQVRSDLGPGAATGVLPIDNRLGRAWIAGAIGRHGDQVVEKLWKLQKRGDTYAVYLLPTRPR